ncbi:alpha/beta fold hydrolase [Streptomyces sp. M19]
MTEYLAVDGGTIAYEVTGSGPLIVLAHGIGDSRAAYRAVIPPLVAAGHRVAAVDLRGSGESSADWPGWSRADIAGDLLAVVRHLGGPAVLVGHSISGGAATIAAAREPELVAAVVELAPFTREQAFRLGDLRVRRLRRAWRGCSARACSAACGCGARTSTWPTRREAGRLERAAGPGGLAAARARPDGGHAGHAPERTGRRRCPARRRPLPGPGRDGHARPRLGRPGGRGRGDRRGAAARPRPPGDDRRRRALPARPVPRPGRLAHARLPRLGRRPCLGPVWTRRPWSRPEPPSPTRWASAG